MHKLRHPDEYREKHHHALIIAKRRRSQTFPTVPGVSSTGETARWLTRAALWRRRLAAALAELR